MQKKRLKRRFWTEVYDGAKMFYLSGVINGRYPDREILNLSRFISVAKFRPLTFRNSHSYLLADRLEDLTAREETRINPNCDRTVALWGYLRGIPMRAPGQNSALKVHIPGSGVDAFSVTRLAQLADPCPLPTIESEKRRKLSDKNRLVHAPFSGGAAGLLGQGAGAVSFDGDRVWVNTAGNFTRRKGEDDEEGVVNELAGEGEKMVMDLQDVHYTLQDRIQNAQLRLFSNDSAALTLPPQQGSSTGSRRRRLAFGEDELQDGIDEDEDGSDVGDEEEGSDSEAEGHELGPAIDDDEEEAIRNGGETAYEDASDSDLDLADDEDGVIFEQNDRGGDILDLEADDLDDEEEDDDAPMWKRNLGDKARQDYLNDQARSHLDLMNLVYATDMTPEAIYKLQCKSGENEETSDLEDAGDEDENLFQLAARAGQNDKDDDEDRFRPTTISASLPDTQNDDIIESFRQFFISGMEDGQAEQDGGEAGFEDLEASEEDADGEDAPIERKAAKTEEDLAAKKERLKRKFDAEYDGTDDEGGEQTDFYTEQKEELRKRLAATQAEFAEDDAETRAMVEGYRPGSYVRLEFSGVPAELLSKFDPKFPLVVGALLPHEENFGYIQVRLKKHRWHPKILKTNDPLIFSIGWRRFQTVPIYSIDDSRTRNRMLKYTPEHMHCFATFWGPISAPNTGFCAFNSLTNEKPTFRISATGVVNDIEGSSKIVKKLKLTGVPRKSASFACL